MALIKLEPLRPPLRPIQRPASPEDSTIRGFDWNEVVVEQVKNFFRLQPSVGERTGAVGDSVTVLPIVVAMAALAEFSLTHLLLGFALFQIVWGIYYGLPISVEPMKALAALVIAGTLTAGELALAGLLAGGVLLVVVCVVGYRRASALVILCLGVVFTTIQTGLPTLHLPTLPSLSIVSTAALEGTAVQLAMTVGNAAIATSLLLSDYYDADVFADDLATSMGVMNMIAIPLGAMPMCHGSGGVAGKYAFGARTAGSNLILGGIYAVAVVFAVGVVAAFPLPMLGVILALIAVELGQAGLDTDHVPLTLGVGVLGMVTNVGFAFGIGILGHLVIERVDGGIVRSSA